MKHIAAAIAVLTLIGGGVYYHYFYPPRVLERATEKALADFTEAVRTHDRANIAAYLNDFMADDASITLSVSHFSLTNPNAAAHRQDFDKPQFIAFIDNILYTMDHYDFYDAFLGTFTPAPDRTSAAVAFSGKAWGDGKSTYGGADVSMRFWFQPACEGAVRFNQRAPQLTQATCRFIFQQVPKPGQEDKFRDLEAIQQLLKENR